MARAAARASADDVARWLFEAIKADEIAKHCATDDLVLRTSDETGDAPQIIWESGPLEWAICLTGGESLASEELAEYGARRARGASYDEVFERAGRAGFYFECDNSFTLAVYPA